MGSLELEIKGTWELSSVGVGTKLKSETVYTRNY